MNNDKKIRCPKCGSTQIRKIEGPDDFLSFKPEGGIAKKTKINTKQKFICLEEKCGYEWKKSEEIKNIIKERINREKIKKRVESGKSFTNRKYSIYAPQINIVNIKGRVKIDDIMKIIEDPRKVRKIEENVSNIISCYGKDRLSKFSPAEQEVYIIDTVSTTAAVAPLLPHQYQDIFLEKGVAFPEIPSVIYQEIKGLEKNTIRVSKKGDNIIFNSDKYSKLTIFSIIFGIIVGVATIIGVILQFWKYFRK